MHVQVNTVTIEPRKQKEQEIKMRDIGKFNQDEEIVTSVTANKSPRKRACPHYEVRQVQTENGIFPIVMIYDTGSEVSLCNYETGPIVVDTKRGDKKVTISTINSIQTKLRKVYKLKVSDEWSLEAIMIPKMKL